MAATPRQIEEVASHLEGITWTARTLEVAEATVRRRADRGEIPMVRMADGTRLFHVETIQRIAAERAAQREARKAEGPA